jgi:hypothetical protein
VNKWVGRQKLRPDVMMRQESRKRQENRMRLGKTHLITGQVRDLRTVMRLGTAMTRVMTMLPFRMAATRRQGVIVLRTLVILIVLPMKNNPPRITVMGRTAMWGRKIVTLNRDKKMI